MDKLLKAIKDKLDSPQGIDDAKTLLTAQGYLNWIAGKELTLKDINLYLIELACDTELIGA